MSSDEPTTRSTSKDFAALRSAGDHVGASRSIGGAFCASRDALARVLLRLKIRPNHVTMFGLALTVAAGYCLARGASHGVGFWTTAYQPVSAWPLLAALFLFLSGACDMLDGAVARVGNLGSRAGAVLDSTVDRLSDMAIFAGCLLHFARLETPNLTYQVLAVWALCNAIMISYVKARAENLIEDCSVGYWLRGERFAAVLIGCTVGHVPAVLWQLSVSGAFTVWRRVTYALAEVRAAEAGGTRPERGPSTRWYGRLQLWRHPRGSVAYDVVTGTHIAFILVAPHLAAVLCGMGPASDPLRAWLGG